MPPVDVPGGCLGELNLRALRSSVFDDPRPLQLPPVHHAILITGANEAEHTAADSGVGLELFAFLPARSEARRSGIKQARTSDHAKQNPADFGRTRCYQRTTPSMTTEMKQSRRAKVQRDRFLIAAPARGFT